MLQPVKVRLDPLFTKLNQVEEEEHLGHAVRVPREVRDVLWSWWNDFEDLYEALEDKGHKLTNKQWRNLKGALKKIGGVSLEGLSHRLEDICKELAGLNITFPKV